MSFKLYLKYWTFCGSFVDWFFIKFHVFIFIFNNFFRIHAIQHWMWTEYLGIASILKWAFYLACWLCLIIQKKLQNLNIERLAFPYNKWQVLQRICFINSYFLDLVPSCSFLSQSRYHRRVVRPLLHNGHLGGAAVRTRCSWSIAGGTHNLLLASQILLEWRTYRNHCKMLVGTTLNE